MFGLGGKESGIRNCSLGISWEFGMRKGGGFEMFRKIERAGSFVKGICRMEGGFGSQFEHWRANSALAETAGMGGV